MSTTIVVSQQQAIPVQMYRGLGKLFQSEVVRSKQWRKSKASGRKFWRTKADVKTHDMPRKYRVMYDTEGAETGWWKVRRTRPSGRNAAIRRLEVGTRKTVRTLKARVVTRSSAPAAGTYMEHLQGCAECASGSSLYGCKIAVDKFQR